MRIGINIPNELMQRLEPLKPDLNISQVCRDALVEKAEKYERMEASLREDEINAVVDVLWEREQTVLDAVDLDWEMLGYEDAAAWSKAAGQDDWDDILEEIESCNERGWPEWRIVPPTLSGVKWLTDHRRELDQREERVRQTDLKLYLRVLRLSLERDPQAIQRKYMTAWLTHVRAVWELVKKRQIEHLERQLAQRAAPPTPEVPEHLLGDAQAREQQRFRVLAHAARLSDGVDPLRLNHLIDDPDMEIHRTDGANGG